GGGLTVGGATDVLRTNASTVSVAGSVNVNNPAGYITSTGAGVWTISGAWTNVSTSASWSFAASITFNASSSQTMTFANQTPEFGGNVMFNSGASTVTFTMAANGIRWAGTLSIQGGSGTTTLTTNDLALTGGALMIGDAGLLVANASTTAVSNVTMIGGTSGTITLTSGSWTVSGNWDTSGLGSSLIAGTSTVTLTGASTTLTLATGQMFYSLVIGGTISITSPVTTAGILTVNNGAVLTKTGQSITFNGLTEIGSGSIADGAISVGNFSVTNSDATNLTTITVFPTWIGGTGSWSQTTHWSSSSGGVNGCSMPNASNPVFFDANSGGGMVTVDLNAAMSSFNTTGWAGTVVIGVFDFVVSGAITHAAGTLTIGASAGSGLTATGGLTLSGSAVLDGSGAPSVVTIAGNTSISSAAAYLKM